MEKQGLPDALFVSDEVVAREVELGDGKTHTLHFKAISHVEFNKWVAALTSPDEDVRDRAHSRLVVASMVTAEGKPALSLEQANRIKPNVLRKLSDLIAEINDFADMRKKN
ncbi:hypothetical protein [Bordetella bronchiseptica]|uniref:Uncharacterized protein n=1 Tax=Bordetella bronchiseptica (strain ATCC BAA-588 / NCTC 13252 / RB50) TaxID=257310 RepID=A0A0H3LQ88_BORBR|nr:hypothetical protein [Bordetella bronchiseptica]KAK69097.1 hypothetical protein AZ22_1646 [Bordetella bronchiseptica 980-2]KCV32876.1 hypothetical protein L489_1898 [Bordetella bronchiseptica 00-P-2730]KDD52214.1 hypothetical protein L533_1795 [Bordetella bronchiseptica OSU553]AMG88087.1 hypothetical protein AL472_09975 [Bordetella bronchiseptica]KCV53161.1 hypothetical protein L491_1743 [Bordetella bronchiseptica 3E44]